MLLYRPPLEFDPLQNATKSFFCVQRNCLHVYSKKSQLYKTEEEFTDDRLAIHRVHPGEAVSFRIKIVGIVIIDRGLVYHVSIIT